MKKLLVALCIAFVGVTAFAEASFDQIEALIAKQQYAAAASGLEGILANHPNSAKAYYAMSQAQAGLGNQDKATFALNKARGLDPELKFASSSNVENLQTALTPQVAKIEPITPSHFWRNLFLACLLVALMYWVYVTYFRDDEEEKPQANKPQAPTPPAPAPMSMSESGLSTSAYADSARRAQENAAAAQARANTVATGYSDPRFISPTYAAATPQYAPAPQTTVIHNHTSNNDGLVTGLIIGDMLSHSHHDTTRIVEREVIREVPVAAPVPSRDSSWDNDSSSSSSSSSWFSSTPSKSSSWDSDSSSSSSSWGSSSSSDSGSSWSDSSSSDSGSSWD